MGSTSRKYVKEIRINVVRFAICSALWILAATAFFSARLPADPHMASWFWSLGRVALYLLFIPICTYLHKAVTAFSKHKEYKKIAIQKGRKK